MHWIQLNYKYDQAEIQLGIYLREKVGLWYQPLGYFPMPSRNPPHPLNYDLLLYSYHIFFRNYAVEGKPAVFGQVSPAKTSPPLQLRKSYSCPKELYEMKCWSNETI
jgi:hypothetical protein